MLQYFFSSAAIADSFTHDIVPILNQKGLSGWDEKTFRDKTSYQVVELTGGRVSSAGSQSLQCLRYLQQTDRKSQGLFLSELALEN